MKCLLCSSVFKNQKELLDHYLSYHNIVENNWFFQKLFQSDNKAFLKNCIRCNQFLATRKEKAIHDFLKHYNDGKSILFEEKPLDIIRYPALHFGSHYILPHKTIILFNLIVFYLKTNLRPD